MIDYTRRHSAKARTHLVKNNNSDLIVPLIEVNGLDRLRSTELMNNNIMKKLNSNLNVNNDKDSNKLNQHLANSKYLEEKSLNSAQSTLLFILTLGISCSQFSIYRYFINNYSKISYENEKSSTNIYDEITIFCWRIQSIFFFLMIYLILSNLVKFDFPFYPLYSNEVDSENCSSNKLISFENFKFSSANLLSSFVLFYSTKFLPLGLVTFFNSFDVISVILFSRNSTKLNLVPNGLFYVGMISVSYFIFKNDFTFDLNSYGMNMLICLLLCFCSLFLIKFVFRPIFEEKLAKHISPLRIIISLYANNFMISFLILSIIQVYNDYYNFFNLIGWILDLNHFIHFGAILGCLGLMFLFVTFISIYYLDTEFLKTLKYLEVPLVDLLGLCVFRLYNNFDWLFFYLVATIQFLFGMFVKDFVIERENEYHHDKKDNKNKNRV